MSTYDLSIIIVSWNVREHLERCLAALPQGAAYAYVDGTVQPGVTYKYALAFVQSDSNKSWIRLAPVTARWWLSFPLVVDQ